MKSVGLKNMQGTPAHIEYLPNPDTHKHSCKSLTTGIAGGLISPLRAFLLACL